MRQSGQTPSHFLSAPLQAGFALVVLVGMATTAMAANARPARVFKRVKVIPGTSLLIAPSSTGRIAASTSGGLIKLGTGAITIGGTNTYSGALTLAAGTPSPTNLVATAGATLSLNGALGSSGGVVKSGAGMSTLGTSNLGTANTYTGKVSVNNGTLVISSGSTRVINTLVGTSPLTSGVTLTLGTGVIFTGFGMTGSVSGGVLEFNPSSAGSTSAVGGLNLSGANGALLTIAAPVSSSVLATSGLNVPASGFSMSANLRSFNATEGSAASSNFVIQSMPPPPVPTAASLSVQPVPEPSIAMLSLFGAASLLARRRRR